MPANDWEWVPPPDQVTAPDQLPPEVWRLWDALEQEHVVSCWKTGLGYLVLTNLRCFEVWRRSAVLGKRDWSLGPQFFFYNLRPPRVVLGRFVELVEEFNEGDARQLSRVAVQDPTSVSEQIGAAVGPGREEWGRRRVAALQLIEDRRRQREAIARGLADGASASSARVNCPYCGTLMPALAPRCPSCGAPTGQPYRRQARPDG